MPQNNEWVIGVIDVTGDIVASLYVATAVDVGTSVCSLLNSIAVEFSLSMADYLYCTFTLRRNKFE